MDLMWRVRVKCDSETCLEQLEKMELLSAENRKSVGSVCLKGEVERNWVLNLGYVSLRCLLDSQMEILNRQLYL